MPVLAESAKIFDILEELNEKAIKEKGPGRPPHWEMVFWWTRKPLIGARAAILSCLLPETVSVEDFRKRILKLDSKSPHKEKIEIEKYIGYVNKKKLLDPFAGFGSIPLEGMKIGLNVTAVDLLPTAYVFLKAVLEYPILYGRKLLEDVKRYGNWILNQLKEDETIKEIYDEDVAVYIGSWEVKCPNCENWTPLVGNWWLARVKGSKGYERLAYFTYEIKYDEANNNKKTIDIKVIDLKRQPKAEVKGREIIIDNTTYTVPEPNVDARRNLAVCLCCGGIIRNSIESGNEWYVKWAIKRFNEGDESFARQRLLIRVRTVNRNVLFEPCTDKDVKKLEIAKEKFMETLGDPDIPTEALPYYGNMGGGLRFPIQVAERWYQLFTPRQLLILTKLVKLIRNAGKRIEEEKLEQGWSSEKASKYAEAVTTYLAIALCKFADFYSRATAWNSGYLIVQHSLAVRGISLQWNFCEISPWTSSTGSFIRSLENVYDGLKYIVDSTSNVSGISDSLEDIINYRSNISKDSSNIVRVVLDDATTLSLVDEKFDIIVTDPPYRDDVAYAELSDFYYVWLKRALSDVEYGKLRPRFLPEAFFRKVGAKYIEIETQWQEFARREVSYNEGRFRDEGINALEHYKELLTESLRAMKKRLNDNGIIALFFAHSSFEAWAELIEALVKAGLRMTYAFPIATERKDRVIGRKKLSIDTSLFIVCRPSEGEEIMLSDLKAEIEQRAKNVAKHLSSKSIPGRDVLIGTMIASICPVTNYSKILTPSGEASIISILKNVVYPIVGKALAEAYAETSEKKEEIRDPYALFYLLAKIAFGGEKSTKPFTKDDLLTLCRASGLNIKDASLLITSTKMNSEEEEEEGGSKVANPKAVKLLEITDTSPQKIREFLSKKNLPISEPRPRNAVDAYHYLLYFASQYPYERIKEEYREMSEKYEFVEDSYKLAKIISKMKGGAEKKLSFEVVRAIESYFS